MRSAQNYRDRFGGPSFLSNGTSLTREPAVAMLRRGGAHMDDFDAVLARYHRDCRTRYIFVTVGLAVYSLVVLLNQETWASASLFGLVVSLLWGFHWNAGRRIKNGAFGSGDSAWSRIEYADIARWLAREKGVRHTRTNQS